MRVAVDFDGVIADTGVMKQAWIRREKGVELCSSKCDRSSLLEILSHEEYAKMQRSVGYADTLDAPPVTGAVDGLARLAKNCHVYILTSREPTKIRWAEAWLNRYMLGDKVQEIVCCYGQEKGRIARSLNCSLLIDNDQRHFEKPLNDVRFVLFGSTSVINWIERDDVTVANSWAQLVSLVGRLLADQN